MLALPRIAAVQNGLGASNRAPQPGKPGGAANNPFVKMLAGLGAGKAARAASPNAPAPRGATEARELRAEARKSAAGRSALGADAADAAASGAVAQTAQTAQTVRRPAVPAENNAKANSSQDAALRTGKTVARPDTANKAKAHADGAEAATVAGSSRAAAMAAAEKAAQVRPQAGNPGSSSRIGGEDSGMETLGSRTENGRDGTRLTVVDMRLKAAKDVSARQGAGKPRSGEEPQTEATKSESSRPDADASFAGRLVARTGGEADPAAAPVRETAAAPRSFTESLATRLRDGAADIVRSAQIVLQNGDSGIIRLRLEPETLGGVKIELKMTEKQISGKIVVESDIAGEAFRSSLNALKDAFAEAGFETTSIEVEVRNGMASGTDGGNANGSGAEGGNEGPYWSRSLRELEAAVPQLASAGRDGRLDVIV